MDTVEKVENLREAWEMVGRLTCWEKYRCSVTLKYVLRGCGMKTWVMSAVCYHHCNWQ